MHEVGDAIFWKDTDNYIDLDDVFEGLRVATRNVGEKILGLNYLVLSSEKYRSIFLKLSNVSPFLEFKRKVLIEMLIDEEKKAFDNFIRKIKEFGIIQSTEIRGEYKFANLLYYNYIMLESFKASKESKK
jgi:hypothetical protein